MLFKADDGVGDVRGFQGGDFLGDAGVSAARVRFADVDGEEFEEAHAGSVVELAVNLWGVINGVHAFTQAMIDQKTPGAIVNTGSKQGITCPPGDTAYNITKAGVKVLTEGLAHSLRNVEGCRVTAHLLVPGSTFTGMTARGRTEKPPGSWTPDQVIDVLVERMGNGDFYIICPDNDVTTDIDNRRILWGAEDIIRNRPPLSRWHPDYADEFAAFLASPSPFRQG
jgi:NAD(P)-dependent dehydrogenase (short-subunit alcohol dehydrogenase family)